MRSRSIGTPLRQTVNAFRLIKGVCSSIKIRAIPLQRYGPEYFLRHLVHYFLGGVEVVGVVVGLVVVVDELLLVRRLLLPVEPEFVRSVVLGGTVEPEFIVPVLVPEFIVPVPVPYVLVPLPVVEPVPVVPVVPVVPIVVPLVVVPFVVDWFELVGGCVW